MAKLNPWYNVVTPREDLRDGRPLDASEFAVHLDKVREGSAPEDYRIPQRFFERTYLTTNLLELGSGVLRRLSGIRTETAAVFNMATQFGGGKTHALTLLYHLAQSGRKAEDMAGVRRLMEKAGVKTIPQAAVATFVGTEFDSLAGRGGKDGTPLRRTPWGEIAWQLGQEKSFAAVAEHEHKLVAPAGDVIRAMLPPDRPTLILIDELLNYISRNRKSGLATQLYDFLQNLSETARGESNVVLAVSIPASELEMTPEDQQDYTRFKKMLDRLGNAVVMSAEHETSEIIRRRLFEWNGLPPEARRTVGEYATWITENQEQVPKWFPVDNAREAFEASSPFHPMVLSVFERKWQSLPRFQQTRGVLRLLALWVSATYKQGYEGGHGDPLIGLGTAPLHDTMFRTALFEQLGEQKLEGAVTTDICGKKESHATRLDAEAPEAIKKARLHRKVATVVFFESNGGQARDGEATVPEMRLAVAEPGLNVVNVDTVIEGLTDSCYYLRAERNKFRFSLTPNLNKMLADRRANIPAAQIDETVRAEVLKVFVKQPGVEVVPFPEKSSQIADRPLLELSVLAPECVIGEARTLKLIEGMIQEHGSAGRTYKSALLFAVAEDDSALREEARKLLAWQTIKDEEEERLDATQRTQLAESLKKAQRDLRECVWRTYKNVVLLGKDNQLRVIDLGLVHSSQANGMVRLIVDRLRQEGDIETSISPNFLVRNWPPAFREWNTKAVRDAFFASPQFPRLLDESAIKDTIARGATNGVLAYVGRSGDEYQPFVFGANLAASEVEVSEDMFILTAAEAKKHIAPPKLTSLTIQPAHVLVKPGVHVTFRAEGVDQRGRPMALPAAKWTATGGTGDGKGGFTAGDAEGEFAVVVVADGMAAQATVLVAKKGEPPRPPTPPTPQPELLGLRWSGEVPPQKWMNFYTKVLAQHTASGDVKLRVTFEVAPGHGVSPQRLAETKAALRELGLADDVTPLG